MLPSAQSLTNIIKAVFVDASARDRAMHGHALLQIAERRVDFAGQYMAVDADEDRNARFIIPRTKDYERVILSGEALNALRNADEQTQGNWLIGEVNAGIRKLGKRLSRNLFSADPRVKTFAGEEVAAEAFAGLPGWLAPTGQLFGLAEPPAPVMVNGGGCSEASVIKLAEGMARSVDPDCEGFYVMNPARHERLIEQWRSKAAKHPELPGTVFFGSTGPREYHAVPDTDCPMDVAYRIPRGAFELASVGAMPHILDKEGVLLRVRDDDAYELIIGWYGQPICHLPARFARITW